MARVLVYDGLSTVIPIFDSTTPDDLNALRLDIKIKEEVVEDPESYNDEHLPSNEPEASCPEGIPAEKLETIVQRENEVIQRTKTSTGRWAEGSSTARITRSSNKNCNRDTGQVNIFSSSNSQSTVEVGLDQGHTEDATEFSDIRTRTRTHSSLIECDICYITLSDETNLKRHKSRMNRKGMNCHVCNRNFANPIQLASHRRSSHRGIDWIRHKYKCDYCNLGFKKKNLVQQHIFHQHNLNEIPVGNRRRYSKKNRHSTSHKNPLRLSSKSKSKKRKVEELLDSQTSNELTANKRQKQINTDVLEKDPLLDNNDLDETFTQNGQETTDVVTHLGQPNEDHVQAVSTPLKPQPPLVKIFAIPYEVETLLNNYEQCPKKKVIEYLDSDESTDDETTDDGTRKEYILRSGLRSADLRWMRPSGGSPTRSTIRQWAVLRRRFKCQDCHVRLERIDIPADHAPTEEFGDTDDLEENSQNNVSESNNTEASDPIQIDCRRTVGIELQNLDLALQKLEHCQKGDSNLIVDENIKEEITEPGNTENTGSSEQPQEPLSPKKTKIIYRSSICRTRFTTQKKLVHHYLAYHTGPTRQECPVCRSPFSGSTELRKHLVLHCIAIPKSDQEETPINLKGPCERYKKKLTCDGCKKTFWFMPSLVKHKQYCSQLHPAKGRQPSSNDHQDTNSQTSTNSAENDIPSQQSRLKILPTEDDNNTGLLQNHSDNTLVAKHKSPEKNSSPGYSSGLSNQRQNNESSTSFPCTICRTQFKAFENLSCHERKFLLQQSVDCTKCGTRFPSLSLFHAHMRATHVTEPAFYKCHCLVCNQGFSSKDYLRQHTMHIHVEELRRLTEDPSQPQYSIEMECRKCNAIFQNRKQFLEHCLYYYDDETFACAMCDKKFLGRFRAHCHTKKVHFTEDKQKAYEHRCSECDEGFIYESHLHSHIRHVHPTHASPTKHMSTDEETNENGFEPSIECNVCNEQFTTLDLLDEHEKEYSNTGKYKCALCQRRCYSSLLLLTHVKIEHSFVCSENQRECHHCHTHVPLESWIAHMKHFHANSLQHSDITSTSLNGKINKYDDSSNSPHLDADSSQSLGFDKGSDLLTATENELDPRSANQYNIEYTCALCDMKFISRTALRHHRSKNECTGVGYIAPTFVDTDETADVDVESNGIDVMISNIYSVDLEEYENLHNSDNDDSINDTETSINNTAEDTNTSSVSSLTCDVCLTEHSTHKALRKHQRDYSNTGIHVCGLCDRKFASKKLFERHESKHKNRKAEGGTIPPHWCEICDERFATSISRHVHFAHIHQLLLPMPNEQEQHPPSASSHSSDEQRITRQQSRLVTSLSKNSPFNIDSNEDPLVEDPLSTHAQGERIPQDHDVESQNDTQEILTLSDSESEESSEESESHDMSPVLCDVCGLVFQNKTILKAHQKRHSNVPVASNEQKKDYVEVDLTKDEDNKSINDYNNRLILKKAKLYNEKLLQDAVSVTIDHNYTQVQCRICMEQFRNMELLTNHLNEIHRLGLTDISHRVDTLRNHFACDPIILRKKQTSNRKELSNSTNPQRCCKICGMQFKNEILLEMHKRNYHYNTRYASEIPNRNRSSNQMPHVAQKFSTLGMITNADNTRKNLQMNGTIVFGSPQVTGIDKTGDGRRNNDNIVLTNIPLNTDTGIINVIGQDSPQLYQLIPIPGNTVLVPCTQQPVQKQN